MKRTDTATRHVDAPPEAVYRALIDPDARLDWLPPTGMTGRFERFDARPGGSYRMSLTYNEPSGSPGKSSDDTDIVEGRFLALEPGRKIVEAVDFVADDPAFAGTMTLTWSLRPAGGGADVTVTAADVPSGISQKDHEEGLASSLENLARFLA
jgi:uncharacterized protein YndB with AHSA1/START domain